MKNNKEWKERKKDWTDLYKIKICTCCVHFLERNNLTSGCRNGKMSAFLRAQELVRLKFYIKFSAFFVP